MIEMNISFFLYIILIAIIILLIYKTKYENNIDNPKILNTIKIKKTIIKKNIKKKPINKKIIKKKSINKKIIKKNDDLVYLDISINNKFIGKIIIKLFSDIVPYTCNNFRHLCIGYKNMSYKKCLFHRIIKDFMIQCGDFNGSGGSSIYNKNFKDENFIIKHDKPYLLSMANHGQNTNGSQFFITTNKTPHLDNKHVVFGIVIKGFDIVDKLNNVNTDDNDKPYDKICIANCGKINL
jgi:cyclophilin family peptidyl-prolyl cis-trans isomerase